VSNARGNRVVGRKAAVGIGEEEGGNRMLERDGGDEEALEDASDGEPEGEKGREWRGTTRSGVAVCEQVRGNFEKSKKILTLQRL
jgi:hypothetical protein